MIDWRVKLKKAAFASRFLFSLLLHFLCLLGLMTLFPKKDVPVGAKPTPSRKISRIFLERPKFIPQEIKEMKGPLKKERKMAPQEIRPKLSSIAPVPIQKSIQKPVSEERPRFTAPIPFSSLQLPPEISQLLKNSPGAQFQFKIPETIKEEEWNKSEFKFYGFYRRVAQLYVDALTKSFQDMKKRYPYIDIAKLPSDIMMSELIFDPRGNRQETKEIQIAQSPFFRELFEKMLSSLQIPNPPTELMENNQFRVNFIFEFRNH